MTAGFASTKKSTGKLQEKYNFAGREHSTKKLIKFFSKGVKKTWLQGTFSFVKDSFSYVIGEKELVKRLVLIFIENAPLVVRTLEDKLG